MEAPAIRAIRATSWTPRQMWSSRILIVFGSPFAASFFYHLPLFCPLAIYRPIMALAVAVPMFMLWVSLFLYMLIRLGIALVRRDYSRMRQVLEILIWGAVTMILFLSPIDLGKFGNEKIAAHGDSIVAALERYKSDHGKYPETLKALEPKYLANSESTGSGAFPKFEYGSEDGVDFSLWVDFDFGDGLQFSRENLEERTDWPYKHVIGNWYYWFDF